MKRRSFLTVLFAALTAPLAACRGAGPNTVGELVEWFERRFDCELGMPCAMGVEGIPPEQWEAFFALADNCHDRAAWFPLRRSYQYQVYALGAQDSPDAERQLVQALYSAFLLPEPGQKLYWRNPAKITLTREANGVLKIRARLALMHDTAPQRWRKADGAQVEMIS